MGRDRPVYAAAPIDSKSIGAAAQGRRQFLEISQLPPNADQLQRLAKRQLHSEIKLHAERR
jgi:hypothetical protein